MRYPLRHTVRKLAIAHTHKHKSTDHLLSTKHFNHTNTSLHQHINISTSHYLRTQMKQYNRSYPTRNTHSYTKNTSNGNNTIDMDSFILTPRSTHQTTNRSCHFVCTNQMRPLGMRPLLPLSICTSCTFPCHEHDDC